jgi:hypothetical protein
MASPRVQRFMELVMNRIYSGVQKNLAGKVLNRRTGGLAKSIVFDVKQEGDTTTGEIGVAGGVKGEGVGLYATVWEFTGHRAFTVRPVRAKALRFGTGPRVTAERVSNIIYRMVAHIPQAAPRPFILPAIKDADPYIRDKMDEYIKRTVDLTVTGQSLDQRFTPLASRNVWGKK